MSHEGRKENFLGRVKKKCQRNKKGREQNMSKEEREIRMTERKTVRKISGRYTIKK